MKQTGHDCPLTTDHFNCLEYRNTVKLFNLLMSKCLSVFHRYNPISNTTEHRGSVFHDGHKMQPLQPDPSDLHRRVLVLVQACDGALCRRVCCTENTRSSNQIKMYWSHTVHMVQQNACAPSSDSAVISNK
jgi:hypothetical protein